MTEHVGAYLRAHRRKAGLSQRDLGRLIGYPDGGSVSRHENMRLLPSLLAAFGYEAVFQVPMHQLFAGLRDAVNQAVEEEIKQFERELLQKASKRPRSASVAHQLEWVQKRR